MRILEGLTTRLLIAPILALVVLILTGNAWAFIATLAICFLYALDVIAMILFNTRDEVAPAQNGGANG